VYYTRSTQLETKGIKSAISYYHSVDLGGREVVIRVLLHCCFNDNIEAPAYHLIWDQGYVVMPETQKKKKKKKGKEGKKRKCSFEHPVCLR
jgi:hypothetical protein